MEIELDRGVFPKPLDWRAGVSGYFCETGQVEPLELWNYWSKRILKGITVQIMQGKRICCVDGQQQT
jgi:hypothetical protein